ncbi:Fc receptor-like A isoform X2 [Octodon degus]|uniref:Fc receptor-like A isoform X2 n=1 Tax=Octodon degus TaxID=10160 RepID=A0A6P6D6U0_OCTDE|nr:Fc receptor-like A isoform X2 [Octodon degus]
MKLGCELPAWALYLSPALLWAAQMIPAAIMDIVQCEGPVSTKESSCHSSDDAAVASTEEAGFQVKGYTFSEPFHLIVSYDWLILQGPSAPIFEGDPLVLRCRAWQDWPLTQVTFYQDGSALGPPGPNREFSIAVVQEVNSGHYHCSGIFRSPGPGSPETASPVAVTVQELFPVPVLRASPSAELQEGSPVTLSCQTKLSPQRSATRLLFSFYKDGKTVRNRNLSSEFQIPMASVEHSGSYWCEAATEDSQVWKHSPPLEVKVQGPSSSSAPPTLNPASQKSAAQETSSTESPRPVPPLATPTAEPPVFSPPDPHLYHQMGILLKHMQDVRVLLGYLVIELRDLSSRLKSETTQPPAQ